MTTMFLDEKSALLSDFMPHGQTVHWDRLKETVYLKETRTFVYERHPAKSQHHSAHGQADTSVPKTTFLWETGLHRGGCCCRSASMAPVTWHHNLQGGYWHAPAPMV